jgi:hypothetical protein
MFVVLVLSTAAAWAMVGLIWLIQIVHYPMLAQYSRALPVEAATDHARRITPVVGPFMAVEGVTALALLVEQPTGVDWLLTWSAAALLGVALASTVVFSVPQHTALARGHDPDAARRLVQTNWIRTVAWTARALILTVGVAQAGS